MITEITYNITDDFKLDYSNRFKNYNNFVSEYNIRNNINPKLAHKMVKDYLKEQIDIYLSKSLSFLLICVVSFLLFGAIGFVMITKIAILILFICSLIYFIKYKQRIKYFSLNNSVLISLMEIGLKMENEKSE